MKKIFSLLVFMAVLFVTPIKAQNMGLGIALKASTMGIGGDVALGINDKMDVRVGFDMMSFKKNFNFNESDINYDATATIKSGSVTALFDYYISNTFFVAGGLGYNLFNVGVNGKAASDFPYGDISIPKDMVGDFVFNVNPGTRISPYLGLGLGRALGSEKNFAFAFELGTYYQGSPDISIQSSGLLAPTSNPDLGQEKRLEGQINQYCLYPVIKISLSYRIVKF
jgi:hypothetical protein